MYRDQGGIPPPAASLPKAPHDMPRSAEEVLRNPLFIL